MRVLITGAGTKYGDAWAELIADEHNVTCFGQEEHPDLPTVVASRSDHEAIHSACEDQDAIIDMPAGGDPNEGWETHSRTVDGTYALLEAACDVGVPSYIIGSSNMVVQGYEVDHAPELYDSDYEFSIDHTAMPRPLSLYGVARLCSENLGRCYAESEDWQIGRHTVVGREYPEHVYVLRWGSVRLWDGMDHPYGDAEYGVEHGLWERGSEDYELAVKRMKCTWFSGRDLRTMVTLMLEDDTVTFDIFYGVSDNDRGWLDITHAKDVLGYKPIDNADEWDEPPA